MTAYDREQIERLNEALDVVSKISEQIIASRNCEERPEFLDSDYYLGGLSVAAQLLNRQVLDRIESDA